MRSIMYRNSINIVRYKYVRYGNIYPGLNGFCGKYMFSMENDKKGNGNVDGNVNENKTSTDTIVTNTPNNENKIIQPKPMISIHDEEEPTLSIKLPFKRLFKRMAKEKLPEVDPNQEFLDRFPEFRKSFESRKIQTLSGLPAENFMDPSQLNPNNNNDTNNNNNNNNITKTIEDEKEEEEQKKQKNRKSFWKKFTFIMMFTPFMMYVYDYKQAMKLCDKRAELICDINSIDMRELRDLCDINNDDIYNFYIWLLNEICDGDINHEMSIDEFGQHFAKMCNILNAKKGKYDDKPIKYKKKYENESDMTKSDIKRELKIMRNRHDAIKEKRLTSTFNRVQSWDIQKIYGSYNLNINDTLKLDVLFCGISHISNEYFIKKLEICYKIYNRNETNMNYNTFVNMLDDMLSTGHFSTKSLVFRDKWWPHSFKVLNADDIATIIWNKLYNGNISNDINLDDLRDIFTELAKGRKWYEWLITPLLNKDYKPWIQLWYVSPKSMDEYNNEQSRIRRENKKKEEQLKKKNKTNNINDINIISEINNNNENIDTETQSQL